MIVRKSETNPNAIELYGTIWGGDSAWILQDIKKIAPDGDLVVHIHSPGGNVTEGNLIMNYIRKRKGKKTAIVDGIAASMAAIMLTAFDEVYIANNAFLMIHQPTMSNFGNAKTFEQSAKLLNAITKQFTDALMARTGSDEETIKEWMSGDTWFTADEAVAAKLVDGVVDAVLEDNDVSAFYQMEIAALAETFPKFEREQNQNNPTAEGSSAINSNQNQQKMKLNAKSLEILGLTAEAKPEDIDAKIAELSARAESSASATAQLEQIRKERVDTLVSGALASGKITADKKDKFTALANADFDLAKDTIEALPAKANLKDGIKPENHIGSDDPRASWTWSDWAKKDTAGLLQIKANDYERYKALAVAANVSLY
jgi:ATP-dependent Clp protease, protease subunit